jgi:hypothetical protein
LAVAAALPSRFQRSSTALGDDHYARPGHCGEIAELTETVTSIGAINDVRLAGGWIPNRVLQIGLGAHVFAGRNRLSFSQTFPDSLRFTPVQQVSNLSYTGFGVSAGAIIRPVASLAIAVSGRKGGNLDARAGDTVVASASIPDRFGVGISYDGISVRPLRLRYRVIYGLR